MPINGYSAIQAILDPQQQGPKVYLRSNSSMMSEASTRLDTAGSPAALDDVYTASETPEARYGMSMQTLQLLKRYDVRELKADEMNVLNSVIKQDIKPEAFTAIIFAMKDRGAAETINAIDVVSAQQTERKTLISQGLATRQNMSGALQEGDEVLAALRHLASVHDALQKDDSVRMAAKDSVYQASQNAQFNDWVKLRSSSGKLASHGVSLQISSGTETSTELQPPDNYVESILRVMKRQGMPLTETAKGASNSEKLDQAWKDYQKWQSNNPPLDLKIELEPETDLKLKESKQALENAARAAYAAAAYSRDQAEEKAPYGTASLEHVPLYQDDPQLRYGLSLQTLQLIKRTDVRNISPDQLLKLSQLLQNRHEMSDDSANALLPIRLEIGQTQQRKTFDWFRNDEQRLINTVSQGHSPKRAETKGGLLPVEIADVNAAINNDRQAQSELQRLATLHEILQQDKTVQVAGFDGIQQATDIEAFDNWAESQSMLDRPGKTSAMQYTSKESLAGIFRTLQRIGVELSPTDKDASASEKLNQAWKDYQTWRGKNPNRRPEIELSPLTVNTYI